MNAHEPELRSPIGVDHGGVGVTVLNRHPECGNPARFSSPRALVKHAGLCPRENTSGNHLGTSRLSGRGRPGLRLAAWRAVWGAIHTNPVYTARLEHLTTRTMNPLAPGQARAAIAAALLRQLHVVVTCRVRWDPNIAGPARTPSTSPPNSPGDEITGRGEPDPSSSTQLVTDHRQPRPSLQQTRLHAVGNQPA